MFRNRPHIQRCVHKRNLHRNPHRVRQQRLWVVLAVDAAIDAEDRGDVVFAFVDRVEVDQVDRRPRHQHHEQHQHHVDEVADEVFGGEHGCDGAGGEYEDGDHCAAFGGGDPAVGEGLYQGDDRQHRAVQVEGVVADYAEQKQHEHQRADGAGGEFDGVHGVHADWGGEHGDGAEDEGQAGAEGGAQVGGPEGGRHGYVGRQVAGVVRHVGREGDLPQRGEGHGGQPTGDVEAATGQKVRGLHVGEDVAEAQHDAGAEYPGADAVEHVDEAVADDADDAGTDGADDDADGHGHAVDHAVQGFTRQHDVGGEEADVHDAGDDHHQQGAEGAELRAALDHLRDAHLRALGRVQRHQHAADQVADEDGDDAPDQVQVEQLYTQGTGDDRQRRDVAAEPQGEQVSYLSMAIFRGHVSNRVFFDKRGGGCCSGNHDELQGKVSTLTYFAVRRVCGALLLE